MGISNCYVSEITIAELMYGAHFSSQYEKHIKEVDRIEELFTVVPIYSTFDLFAKEKARLKKAGQLIPDFDLLMDGIIP